MLVGRPVDGGVGTVESAGGGVECLEQAAAVLEPVECDVAVEREGGSGELQRIVGFAVDVDRGVDDAQVGGELARPGVLRGPGFEWQRTRLGQVRVRRQRVSRVSSRNSIDVLYLFVCILKHKMHADGTPF